MNGKIDSCGNLHINGKALKCPMTCSSKGELATCGDWCPLFGEVEWEERMMEYPRRVYIYPASIKICKRTLTFENLEDERK